MPLLSRTSKQPDKTPVPAPVSERVERGRKAMLKDANHRRLCWKFWRGDIYWYLNEKGALRVQDTVTHVSGGGKPPHRIRNKYNFIEPIVAGKVSAATQRVPGYEVNPSTTDPEDIAASRLAEKVATYGYDKWGVRRATVKAVEYALVMGEGFVMPYFDANVGPYHQVDGRWVGEGEIKLLVLSGNEVFWEPGCSFEDSGWWAVERARPVDEVEQIPGFMAGKLHPDATTAEVPTDLDENSNMVLVTEYFERPCPKYPQGRRLIVANDRLIAPEEPYPVRDAQGRVTDDPVIHKLGFTVDPEQDRDRGIVEHLIDPQRTAADCWNKLLEWKNRTLNPQMIAPVGSMKQRKTDEPGAMWFYNPVGGQKPEWEQPPPVPQALFQMLEQIKRDMREIAADTEVEAGPDVAARTVQAVLEQSRQRWASFIVDLAEFHSKVMRHCLALTAQHYTEPRLVQIRGRYGWESIKDFKGAQLRGQVDVRVLPGSLEVKSREAVRNDLLFIAQNFPGAISPESAMAALNGGNAHKLVENYELDVARANEIVQILQGGPEVAFSLPDRFDPLTGEQVPGFMPRKQDNPMIHKEVVGSYMKTPHYNTLPPETQELFEQYYDGLEMLEQQRAAQQAAQQSMMAEQLGMANAAKPQGKVMPSLPAATNDAAGSS